MRPDHDDINSVLDTLAREAIKSAYNDIIAEDQLVVERLQVALHGRHAERGRLSHLERSTWDLGRYLGNQLLNG